jgi:PAS domain S-box-containing protein
MFKKKIKRIISYLIGDDEDFSLEHRLLISAILIGILISVFGSLINLILSTSLVAVLAPLVLAALVLVMYYFVRFKKMIRPFTMPLIIISIIGISIIWIYNGGINGSNIMPSFVIFILGLIVVRNKFKKYIFVFFIFINLVILLLQRYSPDLITSFPTETDRWNDNVLTMIYSAYLIYLIITFFHKNYTLEKDRAEKSEKKFRALVETANEGILVAQGANLKYANPIVSKITGYTEKELLSTPFIDFVSPQYRDLIKSNFVKRISGLEVDNRYPIKILSKQKVEIWVEMSGAIIDWEGSPALINFVTDITERKQNEIQIQLQNNELIKLNADKDRFISILSHDLRSPFNTIIGYTELLREDYQKYTPDQIKARLGIINDMSKKTFNLLEDLLMWTKSQSGKLSFHPENIDFLKISSETIESVKLNAINKNIDLKNFSTGEVMIRADQYMLKTILRNLVSNAIKFTNPNGKINVYAEIEERHVIITVSDNGTGIHENDIPKLWDIATKHSTYGTANENGTGLGLLLCREFVEKHGGKIWVETEVGKGSNFKFTLPLSIPAEN